MQMGVEESRQLSLACMEGERYRDLGASLSVQRENLNEPFKSGEVTRIYKIDTTA
jgi:hypothetical protein